MLDISEYNASILHEEIIGVSILIEKFHKQLIRENLETYQEPRTTSKSGKINSETDFLRLSGRHFPSAYQKADISFSSKSVRESVVCKRHNKRRESHYEYGICNVGLSVTPCLEMYHTKNFSKYYIIIFVFYYLLLLGYKRSPIICFVHL